MNSAQTCTKPPQSWVSNSMDRMNCAQACAEPALTQGYAVFSPQSEIAALRALVHSLQLRVHALECRQYAEPVSPFTTIITDRT